MRRKSTTAPAKRLDELHRETEARTVSQHAPWGTVREFTPRFPLVEPHRVAWSALLDSEARYRAFGSKMKVGITNAT